MSKRLIWAEDAIDAVRVFYTDECALVDSIEEQIEKLPSAQPQRWIPVTERLPKENDPFYVLCCDDHGEEMIGHVFKSDDSSTGHSAESEECYMYNVVAWMPLPDPWEGEQG